MKPAPVISLHQLSLYNTGRMSSEQVIAAFAARQEQFERIVADIAAEKPRSRAQHHLIVGQRGMGKTMLLARIAAELRTDPELSARFIPLVFAEEQYAVDRLSKFWLNCLDSLADARELASDIEGVEEIDAIVARLTATEMRAAKDDQPFADEVYDAFARVANANGQRPVLLVDNLQLVFERLNNDQQHGLRELLMRPGTPILVGASPIPPPESHDYGAAFYDHFKVHYLRPLDESEMRSLLMQLATAAARDDVRQRVLQHPARLVVLRQLTGGNPRTTLTLFFLYAEDFAPSAFGDLEGLLDRVTPLYKARFEELTPQQQVITSAIANHWDPVTAAVLASVTGLPSSTISSQLDRLEKLGMVERTELFGETRTGYQVAERFFNIWFLMRSASRRQRREVEFLTRFLESFYEPADRSRLARHLIGEDHFSPDRYVWSRAVAASLTEPEIAEELQRHAELAALREEAREARARLQELMDLADLAPETLAFEDLRRKLMTLVPDGVEIEPAVFAKAILGDRAMFLNGQREQLAHRKETLTDAELQSVLNTIEKGRAADERKYSSDAVEWFSQRLASGQIRAMEDAKDWNRAFQQAPGEDVIQLMVNSLPDGFGSILDGVSFKKVTELLEPVDAAPAWLWWRWGRTLHRKLSRYNDAEVAYRKGIVSDPTNSWVWQGLGELLTQLHRFDEAEAAYRRAIHVDPENVWPRLELGNLLERQLERFAEAEVVYRDAGAFDSVSPWPSHDLGNLLRKHFGRFDEAEIEYREAIARDPDNEWPWNRLGNLLHYDLHRFTEAEAAYRKAIACDTTNALLWADLGDLLRQLKRFDEAEAIYREAIARAPKSAWPWYELGILYSEHVYRLTDAAEAFDTAVRVDPSFLAAHASRLFVHRDFLGEGAGARWVMDELRTLSTNELDEIIFLHEALFLAYESNWGLAVDALGRALEIRPNSAPSDSWLRASAVILHLNYGAELLGFLAENGDIVRVRPWVEALRALHHGDRRALENIAPEIRSSAEAIFDMIERWLKALPKKTRRPAVAQPTRSRSKRR